MNKFINLISKYFIRYFTYKPFIFSKNFIKFDILNEYNLLIVCMFVYKSQSNSNISYIHISLFIAKFYMIDHKLCRNASLLLI